jgi:pyridoxine 4-dehydrogenase
MIHSDKLTVGADLEVRRLGFGAMRITGSGVWGEPPDREACLRLLKRVVESGVNLIDTADAYGPEVSEKLIAEALHPYPENLVLATKGGLTRPGPSRWELDCRPERLNLDPPNSWVG